MMRPVKTPPANLLGTLIVASLVATSLVHLGDAQGKSGEEIFMTVCKACHTGGGGRLVGPDLLGVTTRRDPAWLLKFVRSSQSLVKAGDPTAVALFDKFKIPMPDHHFSDAEIRATLAFTKKAPPGGWVATVPEVPASEAEILLGQKLFQGKERLANGGPSCISCHDVTNDAIISGGILARELTTVFGRLGGAGVRSILGAPPFPVMQKAYEGRPLEVNEVTALVGFLERVSAQQKDHMPRDTGIMLAISGLIGVVLLLGFYSLLWGHRRRGSVNQDIYDRQVKST